MSNSELPFMILDEGQLLYPETLWLKRMRRSFFHYRGWPIAEKFDDRYDTEVGGMQTMVTQWIDHGDQPIESNNIAGLGIRQSSRIVERPPIILDYITGDHFSLAEAEERPELSPVVDRLRQRIDEYKVFVDKLDNRDRQAKPDSILRLGYTGDDSKDTETKGQTDEY